MQVSATTSPPASTDADTVVVGLFEGEEPSSQAPSELGELLATGEAGRSFKALALTHAGGKRWLIGGRGARDQFTAESARVVAAVARERARDLSARTLCLQAPTESGDEVVAALVE